MQKLLPLLSLCLAVSTSMLAIASINPAYEKILNTDAPNAKDHPLTGRYQGSAILLQTQKAYDEISFVAGPALAA